METFTFTNVFCILEIIKHPSVTFEMSKNFTNAELKIVNWNLSPLFMEVGSRYGENAREIQERVVSATRKQVT